jgi:hypothetical protein
MYLREMAIDFKHFVPFRAGEVKPSVQENIKRSVVSQPQGMPNFFMWNLLKDWYLAKNDICFPFVSQVPKNLLG